MPLSFCKKLNIRREKNDARIIQLDRSQVPAIGELNNVIIRLSSDSRVHQCIDIVVVDIPEAYGLLLSRDWSRKAARVFFHQLVPPVASLQGLEQPNQG